MALPLFFLQEDHLRPQRDQCTSQVLSPAAGGRGRAVPGPCPHSGLSWLCDLGQGLALSGPPLQRQIVPAVLFSMVESCLRTSPSKLRERNWKFWSRLGLGLRGQETNPHSLGSCCVPSARLQSLGPFRALPTFTLQQPRGRDIPFTHEEPELQRGGHGMAKVTWGQREASDLDTPRVHC